MCLAIPVRVLAVEASRARVDVQGNETTIDISLVPDVKVGEYVLVHAGLAIERYDEEEARKTLDLLRELADSSRAGWA